MGKRPAGKVPVTALTPKCVAYIRKIIVGCQVGHNNSSVANCISFFMAVFYSFEGT